MPSPDRPAVTSPPDEHHARLEEIDAAIIDLLRRRLSVMEELDSLRRDGRVPRVELTRENAVFQRYEAELGRLGTGLVRLLTGTPAPRTPTAGNLS
ncbi:MAG TPA: chorismate mutase [Streptomyces sp.]|jgi:chorismate mutase|nr:chorismate mutase [Streptomyces sp.]